MKKRCVCLLLAAVLAAGLCGCSGIFEKEYVVIEDYEPSYSAETTEGDKVVVKNLSALRQAIQNWVMNGQTEGNIVFDTEYSGNSSEDMASACWQVRTENALCAYCVENISYELNRIVSHDEAVVHISFSPAAVSFDDIIRLNISTDVEELILDAIGTGRTKLVMYIQNGTYTAEGIENLVTSVYRKNPVCVPKEPTSNVVVYSGTGMQRLYDITFNYGMTAETYAQRMEQFSALNVFAEADTDSMTEGEKALAVCSYLTDVCSYSPSSRESSAYAALILGSADSEGLALACVELCHELGLSCEIVYGQKDWENHCWNIVSIDGNNYHVDVSECIGYGMNRGFLINDKGMWGSYRWDISSYASCEGDLNYYFVAGISEPEENTDTEEGESEIPDELDIPTEETAN